MAKESATIDAEPRWVNLIPELVRQAKDEKNDTFVISELTKIAVIADKVRKAQKNKEKLVFDFSKETTKPQKPILKVWWSSQVPERQFSYR